MSAQRRAKLVKKFRGTNKPCFGAYYKAIAWLHKNGFSYGGMCRDEPICVMRGDFHWIAKWKNLTTEEKESSDGLLISEDFRNGDVTLKLYCKVAK